MSPTVELYSPESFADPYAYHGRLRETDPVHWYPPEDAELVAVTDAVHVEEFIQMDPPEHTGRRAAVSPRFAPSVLERWRLVVRQIIGDLRRNGSPEGPSSRAGHGHVRARPAGAECDVAADHLGSLTLYRQPSTVNRRQFEKEATVASVDMENRATVSRTTCGWRKAGLDRDAVRRYWRDVHSPAIARRAGVHWYRHSPFDAVDTGLFAHLEGIELAAPADAQLMWQSDVVYLDEDAVATFVHSPDDPQVTALLLADIEMIVDRSTTYRTVGENARTYVDSTEGVPTGPVAHPTYGLFFRARGEQEPFRTALRSLAERWGSHRGVLRLRLDLFDVPDMEAERRAGYPVKTHPAEQQYQAWIELVLTDSAVAAELTADGLAEQVATLHAYPVPAVYTFVHDGDPTLIGLRGFAAQEAIDGLGAEHARDPRLLEWMYGKVTAS